MSRDPKWDVEILCCSLCGARYKNHKPVCDCIERWARFETRTSLAFMIVAAAVMRGVIGKRLTFRRLCAIGDSGFMGID